MIITDINNYSNLLVKNEDKNKQTLSLMKIYQT